MDRCESPELAAALPRSYAPEQQMPGVIPRARPPRVHVRRRMWSNWSAP